MAHIKLTTGEVVKLSPQDALWASQWRWRLHRKGYAYRCGPRPTKAPRYLHREILARVRGRAVPKHLHVDHINRVRLDNRRANLRAVTPRTNNKNRSCSV